MNMEEIKKFFLKDPPAYWDSSVIHNGVGGYVLRTKLAGESQFVGWGN